MNDWTLALAGVLLGVGSSAGWAARGWWDEQVPRGWRWVIRWIYRHVDGLLGATEYENQERADRRRRIILPRFKGWRMLLYLIPKKVRTAYADYREPIPRVGAGTNPLPDVERMARYVQIETDPPQRAIRLWAVNLVRLYWSPEAAPLRGSEWPRSVAVKVAQALRLESADQLEWVMDYDRGCVEYRRKGPAPERPTHVPVGVNADA